MKLLMTTIYHNPRCSKSRATMKLVEEAGVTPKIVLYLEQPPDTDTLKSIIEMLGCPVSHIIRKGEAIYRELVWRAGLPMMVNYCRPWSATLNYSNARLS